MITSIYEILRKINYSNIQFTDLLGLFPGLHVSPMCDLKRPELFFFLFPVIIKEMVESFIVSVYREECGISVMQPIGTIFPDHHPSLFLGIHDDDKHVMTLATGRLESDYFSCSICFSSVQIEIGDGLYESLLPDKLQEAGDTIFELYLNNQEFCVEWINSMLVRTVMPYTGRHSENNPFAKIAPGPGAVPVANDGLVENMTKNVG